MKTKADKITECIDRINIWAWHIAQAKTQDLELEKVQS